MGETQDLDKFIDEVIGRSQWNVIHDSIVGVATLYHAGQVDGDYIQGILLPELDKLRNKMSPEQLSLFIDLLFKDIAVKQVIADTAEQIRQKGWV